MTRLMVYTTSIMVFTVSTAVLTVFAELHQNTLTVDATDRENSNGTPRRAKEISHGL